MTQPFRVFIPEAIFEPSHNIFRGVADVDVGTRGRPLSDSEWRGLLPRVDAIMVTSKERISREAFEGGRLRVISKYGAPPDKIDLDAARTRGVTVLCTPGANSTSVAEFTLTLVLALMKGLPAQMEALSGNAFRHPGLMSTELAGRTVGLLGFGNIARKVAARALAFEAHVVAHDPYVDSAVLEAAGVAPVSLETLFETSDVLSLHAQMGAATAALVDADRLRRMRPGALLVNTARGGLLDEAAVAAALASGHLGGVATDVFSVEPPPPDHPLRQARGLNLIATPHVAAFTRESLAREACWAAEDVVRVLRGEAPVHCNPL